MAQCCAKQLPTLKRFESDKTHRSSCVWRLRSRGANFNFNRFRSRLGRARNIFGVIGFSVIVELTKLALATGKMLVILPPPWKKPVGFLHPGFGPAFQDLYVLIIRWINFTQPKCPISQDHVLAPVVPRWSFPFSIIFLGRRHGLAQTNQSWRRRALRNCFEQSATGFEWWITGIKITEEICMVTRRKVQCGIVSHSYCISVCVCGGWATDLLCNPITAFNAEPHFDIFKYFANVVNACTQCGIFKIFPNSDTMRY